MDWVERKRGNKEVEDTKEEPNSATVVIVGRRPTIHQQSIQRNKSITVTKPNIIMQALNFTNKTWLRE
jgi:hypothetical protein